MQRRRPAPVPRTPTTIARISQLDLRARQVVEGFITGHAQEPVLRPVGRVRPAPRVHRPATTSATSTGRCGRKTDKFYIKQYEAETNLRANVVVDASESMLYGIDRHRKAGTLYKYEYACTAAACLAYLTIKQQDSCGLITFDEDVRAGRSRRAARRRTWTPSPRRCTSASRARRPTS